MIERPGLFLPSLLCLCGVLFFVGFATLFVGIIYLSRKQRAHAWRELAARTGLTFEPGSALGTPRVVGMYRGRALQLDTFTTRGTGEPPMTGTTFTRIVLAVNNRPNVFGSSRSATRVPLTWCFSSIC